MKFTDEHEREKYSQTMYKNTITVIHYLILYQIY
jgi:hypothetical protein